MTLGQKIKSLSTQALKSAAAALIIDAREGSDLALSAVLDELLSRMDEAEFVSFCGSLED